MPKFFFRRLKGRGTSRVKTPPDLYDPPSILLALDKWVREYQAKVDVGHLVYPACTRTRGDIEGNVRAIWEHTRLEAFRYLATIPGRNSSLLIESDRQREMLDILLRQRAHEQTVIEYNGIAEDDLAKAILAGLNWLDHCASLVGISAGTFRRTQRDFRKLVVLAGQWWALDGAAARCKHMIEHQQLPPLIFYVVWQNYTRLAKEITIAKLWGSSSESMTRYQREFLANILKEKPGNLALALAELSEMTAELEQACEPMDLPNDRLTYI